MKKLMAILLTLAVLCSVTVAASAAEAGSAPTTPVEMKYQDIDASVYDGVWVKTGLGFDVYLPEDWVLVDITDDQAAAGLAFLAGEDGGGANLTVTRMPLPEEVADSYDYEQLGQELAASNTTAMYADLNGIPAVVFKNDETKVCGFCFLPDDGTVVSGVISAPTDDQFEEYSPYMENIIMSVSPSIAELVWENYEADVKEADPNGRFVSLEDAGVRLWVTSLLEEKEVTDEDAEAGCIAFFEDADQAVGMSVWLWDYDGITLEEFADMIRDDLKYTNPYYCIINGLEAINYMDAEQETVFVDFVTEDGYVLEFCFWPATDTGYYSLAQFMTASIQAE